MSGKQVFLYGPFADADLRNGLFGAIDIKATPAVLKEFSLTESTLKGTATLRPQDGGEVRGVVLSGLSETDQFTLDIYLQVHGAVERPILVRMADQDVHVEAPIFPTNGDGPWDETLWKDIWGPIWCASVPEIQNLQPTLAPSQIATRLPVIWSRASAQLAALQEPRIADSGLVVNDITLHNKRRVHSNFFAVDELSLSHARFDGTQGPVLQREVFVAADAVTVLPYDPIRDVVLLVEQIRMGPLVRGDRFPWVMEPVAGRIEPGDSPEGTAHKEAMEEAGLKLGDLHHVASYYPSTGCFTEFVHSYVGIAELPETAAKLGGVDAEGEDIKGHILSRDDLMTRIAEGTLPDGPLVLSAFWLQANVAQIRGFG